MSNLTFRVSLFDSKTDSAAKETVWTWQDICKLIEQPEIRFQKDGRAFSPSVFSSIDGQSPIRRNENAEQVSLVVFDFDENLSLHLLKERFDSTGCLYILHSTHSHLRQSDKNPNAESRFRAIIPLALPVPTSEFPKLWTWIKNKIDLPADESKKAVASIFYLPTIAENDSPYDCHIQGGELLDWQEIQLDKVGSKELNSLSSLSSLGAFEFHEDRHDELCGRIELRGRLNPQGKIDAKCLAHNGNGKTSLFYNPQTGSICCNAGCDYLQILKAEGLSSEHLPSRTTSGISKKATIKLDNYPIPDDKCFYGLAGKFIHMIEPCTEADKMALLVQFLTAFGSIIGRNAHFRVEGDKHYTNLFSVLVGDTAAGRKGTSWGRVKEVFEGLDEHFDSNGIVAGLASGEGLINSVRDAIEKNRVKPGGTVETTIEDVGILDKRLLVFEGEFSQVLRVQGSEGNTLSSVIRNLWDTGNAQNLTKNSPLRTTNAHVSIIGHITKSELTKCLGQVESVNGYANRFLWVCVKRSQLLPFGAETPEAINDVKDELRDCIQFAKEVQQLNLSRESRDIWSKAQ